MQTTSLLNDEKSHKSSQQSEQTEQPRPSLKRQISSAHQLKLTGKALTNRGKKLQILRARGIFLFLPVRFCNDIVHGSWYDIYTIVKILVYLYVYDDF